MRHYVSQLEASGEMLVVEREVDPRFELAAVTLTSQRASDRPLMFRNVRGSAFPVVTNLYGSHARLCDLIGASNGEYCRAWAARVRHDRLAPEAVQRPAPAPESVQGRLGDLPLITYSERDAGPYFTSAIYLAKEPATGVPNLSFHRTMFVSDDEVRVRLGSSHDLARYKDMADARDEPLEAALLIGPPPEIFLAAAASLPHQADEMAAAAQIAGAPIEVRPCRTIDLMVPAATEIVVEGRFLPNTLRPEGPFGEFMGYYASAASEQPIVKIKRVYWRTNPILTLAIPSRPPENFTFARATVKSAMIWEEVEKAGLPGVQGVWCHEAGAGRLFNVISIKQMYPGHATQAGMLAATCHAGNYAGRWVVVVDEDIDPTNMFDVVWAMSTRCDPPKDIQYIKRSWSTPLDPLLRGPPYENNRAVVDACRPYDWKDDFPIVAEASPALKAKVRDKWPELY